VTRIRLAPDRLGLVRLARSPLLEVALSVRVMLGVRPSTLYSPWVRSLRGVVERSELELEPLLLLSRRNRIASVLCGPPDSARPELPDELDRLRSLEPDTVQADIRRLWGDRVPAAAVVYRRDPAAALSRLAEAIERYWQKALAPHWSRMAAVLDRDLLYRARRIADGSVSELFADLHPTCRLDGTSIELDGGTDSAEGAGTAGEVVLIASVFCPAWPVVGPTTAGRAAIAYRARGLGELWQRRTHSTRRPEALSALLGRSRAALLYALREPGTPTDLARTLRVSQSAVSQHLAALAAAGVVRRLALGRNAYYQLTDSGEAMVNLFH
jgi:DNA-binding transcriptional ArsR family regulator